MLVVHPPDVFGVLSYLLFTLWSFSHLPTGCACFAGNWLEAHRQTYSDIDSNTGNPADMTLPVSIGPNRCELIYNHEKQPLLELSLRVCLPVRELLSVLSQLAPPSNHQPSKMQRPAKGPPDGAKRKASNAPQPGLLPARQFSLPQGSSSSDWQPPYNPWEQRLEPSWEPCPGAAGEWQDECVFHSLEVEEQAQLLWALSDQSVPRYRKTPPTQPRLSAPVKKRTDREVRFASPPEDDKGFNGPLTIGKSVAAPPRVETKEEAGQRSQEGSSDEHSDKYCPPPRPGAHPKKCPVQ